MALPSRPSPATLEGLLTIAISFCHYKFVSEEDRGIMATRQVFTLNPMTFVTFRVNIGLRTKFGNRPTQRWYRLFGLAGST